MSRSSRWAKHLLHWDASAGPRERKVKAYLRMVVSYLIARGAYPRPRLIDIRSILVLETKDVGDVVLSTPIFASLARCFPSARIEVLADGRGGEILRHHPFVGECLLYQRDGEGWPGGRYDLVIDLTYLGHPEMALRRRARFWVSRAAIRVEERLKRRHLPLRHEVEEKLAVLTYAGIPVISDELLIRLTDEEREEGRFILSQHGVREGEGVVIHAAAPWPPRAWGQEGFAAVAQDLLRRGFKPLFVGTAQDGELIAGICRRVHGPVVDLAGRTTLRQLAAIMAHSAFVVGNDSGPLHLAAALKKPVVALFGPQLPEFFGPWKTPARVVHHKVSCCPCDQVICQLPGHSCMDLITAAEVESAIDDLLKSLPAAPRRSAGNVNLRPST